MAHHLGHSQEIHRRYYRTHNEAIEMGKMVKLLHSCEQGVLHTQTGMNIDTMGRNIQTISSSLIHYIKSIFIKHYLNIVIYLYIR